MIDSFKTKYSFQQTLILLEFMWFSSSDITKREIDLS